MKDTYENRALSVISKMDKRGVDLRKKIKGIENIRFEEKFDRTSMRNIRYFNKELTPEQSSELRNLYNMHSANSDRQYKFVNAILEKLGKSIHGKIDYNGLVKNMNYDGSDITVKNFVRYEDPEKFDHLEYKKGIKEDEAAERAQDRQLEREWID